MAILFSSVVDSAPRWRAEVLRHLPDREFRVWPEIGDPAAIDCAIVWRPIPGLLASLPNLKLILSLGAGVDHLLDDPQLPRGVPLVRLVDPYLSAAMSEFVALGVLRLHRQDFEYLAQQRREEWRERDQKNAGERPVGILGFGEIGQEAGRRLQALGFPVAGWTRTARTIPAFTTFHGPAGFDAILRQSEILVCLLPLTPETTGILNTAALARLPRGAGLVNAGRGGHLVEGDLIPALDSGQLSGAVIDVFRDEPLPRGHPFWRHPRIAVTPHIAGTTNPATAAPIMAAALRDFEAGRPVANLVDLSRGY